MARFLCTLQRAVLRVTPLRPDPAPPEGLLPRDVRRRWCRFRKVQVTVNGTTLDVPIFVGRQVLKDLIVRRLGGRFIVCLFVLHFILVVFWGWLPLFAFSGKFCLIQGHYLRTSVSPMGEVAQIAWLFGFCCFWFRWHIIQFNSFPCTAGNPAQGYGASPGHLTMQSRSKTGQKSEVTYQRSALSRVVFPTFSTPRPGLEERRVAKGQSFAARRRVSDGDRVISQPNQAMER
jgi:hypothetical protein